MLNEFFFNCVWTSCPISASYVGSFLLMNVSFTYHYLQILRTLAFWGTGIPRDIQQHKFRCEKLAFWCAVHSNAVVTPYYFNDEQSEKSIIIRCWTFPSGQTLKISTESCYPEWTELLLKLSAPPVLFCKKCFRLHTVEDMVQQARQQDHRTESIETFPLRILEKSSVSCFWA